MQGSGRRTGLRSGGQELPPPSEAAGPEEIDETDYEDPNQGFLVPGTQDSSQAPVSLNVCLNVRRLT